MGLCLSGGMERWDIYRFVNIWFLLLWSDRKLLQDRKSKALGVCFFGSLIDFKVSTMSKHESSMPLGKFFTMVQRRRTSTDWLILIRNDVPCWVIPIGCPRRVGVPPKHYLTLQPLIRADLNGLNSGSHSTLLNPWSPLSWLHPEVMVYLDRPSWIQLTNSLVSRGTPMEPLANLMSIFLRGQKVFGIEGLYLWRSACPTHHPECAMMAQISTIIFFYQGYGIDYSGCYQSHFS